jgi:triacylglycerol lipase
MKPTVIMLHGLARTKRSLAGLRRHLEEAGYPTWSISYPSRKAHIATLADDVAKRIEDDLSGRALVAVTHSLGGIIARHIADRLALDAILMLAPPNQGSRAARAMEGTPLFRAVFGPAGRDVQSSTGWPVPRCPVAVIAGTSGASLSAPPSWVLGPKRVFGHGEAHDGVVAVSETHLEGMHAFATVPANHTWIMNDRATRRLVLQFLGEGRFTAP